MTEKVCSICNGTGWIFIKEDGADTAKPCVCRIEKLIKKKINESNIPKRFAGLTFKYGYVVENIESRKMAKAIAKKFVEDYPANEKGLLFQGGVGLGKTTLLCIIGNELIKKNVDAYYIDWNDLTRIMGSGEYSTTRNFDKINSLVRTLTRVELLLFDELGASKASPWVQEQIYYIINMRYNNKKMSLFATNYFDKVSDSRDTLTDRVGDRIRSRLYEMTKTIVLKGKDYRR